MRHGQEHGWLRRGLRLRLGHLLCGPVLLPGGGEGREVRRHELFELRLPQVAGGGFGIGSREE